LGVDRTHAQVAKAQLADLAERPDWQTATRELSKALVQVCQLVDDLEERVAELEKRYGQ
jgi:hypothetical protein